MDFTAGDAGVLTRRLNARLALSAAKDEAEPWLELLLELWLTGQSQYDTRQLS
jgi:hypothetical protein